MAAAEQFEMGKLPPEDEFRTLLEGSSRAGGARPKALVHNAAGEWLARFPSTVSLRTLCLERPGVYVHAYSDLAQVIRIQSAAPKSDVAALFRHMAFNAALGNVDDHLKNFWMLAMPEGYRLAPAFDLVPDITGRSAHTLSFRSSFACPTGNELMSLADDWGVDDAAEITLQVIKAVRNFTTTA